MKRRVSIARRLIVVKAIRLSSAMTVVLTYIKVRASGCSKLQKSDAAKTAEVIQGAPPWVTSG
jgi:hypothetical protein